jgi:hypothetical protein
MALHGLGSNDTIYRITTAYTNQCTGPDPTQALQDLEDDVQEHLDTIWRQMSKIDSIGRAEVIEACGDAENFTAMLTGARNLAKILTAIRRSISNTRESLHCSVINPIYVQASHEALCTETLNAAVYGFIMFLIVAICTMIMITLRASWLRHIPEEKVYHDEDEVAENMILDEHEEYLAYISRYKHEWQEYGGFENDASVNNSDGDSADDEVSAEDLSMYSNDAMRPENKCSYDGSEERSNVSEIDLSSLDGGTNIPKSYGKTTVNDGSDDIIALRPTSGPGADDVNTVREGNISIPPLLPPPQRNPQYSEEEPSFANFSDIPKTKSSSDKSYGTSSSASLVAISLSLPHKTTEPTSNVGKHKMEAGDVNPEQLETFSSGRQLPSSFRRDLEPADSDNFDLAADFHICSHDQSNDEVEVRLSDRPTRQDPLTP